MQDSGRELVVESANFAFNSLDLVVEEPKTFAEAYNSPNLNDKIKWREAISKEFDDMSAKGVWKKIQKSDMPNGRNCIKSKWIAICGLQRIKGNLLVRFEPTNLRIVYLKNYLRKLKYVYLNSWVGQ